MFSYDRYGNRTVDTSNTTSIMIGSNPQINASTNRITPRSSPVEYYEYDAAGNLKKGQSGETFAYNAENKLVQYEGGAAQLGGADYFYDGNGKRVKKVRSSGTTIFVYDISGQLVAEYTSSTPENNGTRYLTTDILGTPRVMTKADGSVNYRHDYLPFGEGLYAGDGNRTGVTSQCYDNRLAPTDKTRQRFTNFEREEESGLDFAQNRYYDSSNGRFGTVDPLMASAKPINPQTLNRYVYVLNRPTIAIDPDGLSIIIVIVSPRSTGGNGSAVAQVFDRNGNDASIQRAPPQDTNNRIDGFAIGFSTDRSQRQQGNTHGGDTPFGVYRPAGEARGRSNANGTQGGVSGVPARANRPRLGTAILYLEPVSGEVIEVGRTYIYLHSGATLEDNQRITPTDGCVRFCNGDMNDLVRTVDNLAASGDRITNVFIGDISTLNRIANERDQNGHYLYPELRNAFGAGDGPLGPRPRFNGNPTNGRIGRAGGL